MDFSTNLIFIEKSTCSYLSGLDNPNNYSLQNIIFRSQPISQKHLFLIIENLYTLFIQLILLKYKNDYFVFS